MIVFDESKSFPEMELMATPHPSMFMEPMSRWDRTCGSPSLSVVDGSGKKIFSLVSECCQCSFGSDIEYKIIDAELGVEVGQINKQFNGFMMECCTDADNFLIHFPVGIDMYRKSLLLGAALSIDFMFYETKNNQ